MKSDSAQKAPMIFTALAALILSFGLLFGVQYVGQSQNLQNQAAQGQTVMLRMNGGTVDNNVFHVDFYVNSQGYNLVGTQVSGKITGVNTGDVSVDLTNALNLQAVGSKLTQSGSDVVFNFTQFAPLDTSKKVNTNGQELKFATITVRRNQGTTFTVSLDQAKTSIPVSGNAQISLDMMQSRSFTISQYQATKTTPTPTPTPGANNPDNGIHRSCNQYCADKNECASGLSCYYNKCRNPQNISSESCSTAPSPKPTPKVVYVPAATPTPASPKPTPSPVASPLMSPSPYLFVSPSASASATPSSYFYDENSLKVSPSPTIKKASPSPTTAQSANSTNNNRLLTAGLIMLVALGIVVPAGIYFYRRVR